MALAIMVQGTASSVGKSIIAAGLCRIFKQDGYNTAPFKSQNMALNSYITDDNLEISRAQAVQAEAAGVAPLVYMNPILLKPTSDMGSQVIINGEIYGNMTAREYYNKKSAFLPAVTGAYKRLSDEFEIIVIEGAGSPAEINLNKDDFVNMGMARIANAPVLLVGDIDKGGVFAQIYGTVALLDKVEQDMIKAVIVNKFKGDITLFDEGRVMLSDIIKKPAAGVVPFLDIDIDDEDSLSARLDRTHKEDELDIAVIRLPRLSNFTDFTPLKVRYVTKPEELNNPDMIIIPGTKSTVADLKWLREAGLEAMIKKFAARGVYIMGICGGYQILGWSITDEHESILGMGLLPVVTKFSRQKERTKTGGVVIPWGINVSGYEIHMGITTLNDGAGPFIRLSNGEPEGCYRGNIFGTYLHGFFDGGKCREYIYNMLGAKGEGVGLSLEEYKNKQYDKLAFALRQYLDMELIYKILKEGL